jgi:hypothetical protein
VARSIYVSSGRHDISGRYDTSESSESMESKMLAKFDYHLDESDPDIVVLRRQDGTFVAAFSAYGVTREGIVQAAKEDYRMLLEANAESLDLREEGDR